MSYGILKVLFASGDVWDNIEMSRTTEFGELEANEATTIRLPKPPISMKRGDQPTEVDKAEVFVQVDYRPVICPLKSHFVGRFILKKLPSGNFIWIPIAKSIPSE